MEVAKLYGSTVTAPGGDSEAVAKLYGSTVTAPAPTNAAIVKVVGSAITAPIPTRAAIVKIYASLVLDDIPNQPPVVDAGEDQTIVLPAVASLEGTATDDGLPDPPAALTYYWSMVSGPGTVTFSDETALITTASFSIDGTYVLELTADDSELSASDTITVIVSPEPPPPEPPIMPDIKGPYCFDPTQPFVLSRTSLDLAQKVNKGVCYGSLQVASGASAIESGWLLFNYGESSQVGPVRCFGSTDDVTLQVDSGFKFPVSLAVGARVNVLLYRGTYESESPIGAFWVTASNIGRATAIDLLKLISAAGIQLTIATRYPGDRGLGGEGCPVVDSYKLSDIVTAFGRDDVEVELAEARGEVEEE